MSPRSLPNDPAVTLELAKSFGLNEEEYQRVLDSLGRGPTYAELGVYSVMWSEHCSYKSSRVHLGRLPTEGPQVVQGPGENAGAVDIGDGFCAVFKMESHNHPSYIEPYQGAATGVGGILRDVFTMGARPIANLNSLRFGKPDHPRTEELLRGVVAGISGYGNSIGVPTVGGEVQFDESYDGNILVNAFAMGIAKSDELFFGVASGVGNKVLYVGAKTGRDGIHGATMASAEFDEDSDRKLPTVQVGDPFTEQLLLEACLEIFATDCLEGVQDMGAAGLTSSSVEMAARAGTGLDLDLDAIPRRTTKLTPYEMLLSESQERMLMVAKPGREQEVFTICEKWDLDVAVVGTVTDTGRFVCRATVGFDPLTDDRNRRDPVIVVDIPIPSLADDAPKYDRPQKPPAPYSRPTVAMPGDGPPESLAKDAAEELLRLLSSPNIGSRSWIWRQYDHIVRVGTVQRPGESDAAVVRAFCHDGERTLIKYLAISADVNGRHVRLSPYHGAAMAVAECARNVVCSGAKPLGLTDCLNFGNPENPETMWTFAQSIDGIRDACLALDTPVVSGNVSLYNETDGSPILPTPTVAVVGILESPEHVLGQRFREPGHAVVHLGEPGTGNLGGGEWLTQLAERVTGAPQQIDLDKERALQDLMRLLTKAGLLKSAHDLSDGGLGVALAECVIGGEIGAEIVIPWRGKQTVEGVLFSEEPSRIIVSTDDSAALLAEAKKLGVAAALLGKTTSAPTLSVDGLFSLSNSALTAAHGSALRGIVGDE